ncbi:MAG: hypothetical protein GY838_14300 [bacterium]|nr:hypothetical protein [bacterium]
MRLAFLTAPRTHSAAFLLVVLLSITAGTSVLARPTGWEPYGETWYDVTLVTADGQTYDGLKVQWLTNGARLRATRSGGTYRDYQPEEIRRLKSTSGGDMTDLIAAARPGGSSRDDDDPGLGRNREPKIFSQSFDVGFGYAMVLGEFFGDQTYGVLADMDEGLNAHVGFRAGISERSYLRLMYRHQLANIEPVFDRVDSVWVDLSGYVGELTLSLGTALTDTRQGAFAMAELGAGVVSRKISGPDFDERVYAFAFQVGLITMRPLDDASAIELGASLTIKPSWAGSEDLGGALMRAYVGYSFVGW